MPATTRIATACAALLLLAAGDARPQAAGGVPLMKPPLAASRPAAAVPGQPRTIAWEALVPSDWDPFKDFRSMDLQSMDDGDPRAVKLLRRMREVWDDAPVNTALAGQAVRIPGFVVPLEEAREGLKEFLLVPYFGACIHSPPPPSNQIIHVLPRQPVGGTRSMDAVWVTGTLSTVRTDSYMGAASWRIDGAAVQPYDEKKARR